LAPPVFLAFIAYKLLTGNVQGESGRCDDTALGCSHVEPPERSRSESVLALPGLGVQLTSSHGLIPPSIIRSLHPRIPGHVGITVQTTFIPVSAMRGASAVILHEGIRRWSIVYYLGVIATTEVQSVQSVRGADEQRCGDVKHRRLLKEVHLVFPVSAERGEQRTQVFFRRADLTGICQIPRSTSDLDSRCYRRLIIRYGRRCGMSTPAMTM
jgi:hypothetical protein